MLKNNPTAIGAIMGVAHSTVEFEALSGISRDNVVNTFTWEFPGDFIALDAAALIKDKLDDFYGSVAGGAAFALGTKIGTQISRTVAPILRVYDVTNDLGGTPAGSPLQTTLLANLPPAASGNCHPEEVAFCLTFHADYGVDVEFGPGTRPRSRDRGRVYLGPLTADTISMGGGEACRPSAALKTSALQAGVSMTGDAACRLVVWSRASQSVKPVTRCSVDDAFDTQRRRGASSLLRTFAP